MKSNNKLLTMFLGLQLLVSPSLAYSDDTSSSSSQGNDYSHINYNDLSGNEIRSLFFDEPASQKPLSNSSSLDTDLKEYIIDSIHDVYDMYKHLNNKSDYFYYFIYNLQDEIGNYDGALDTLDIIPPHSRDVDEYYDIIDSIDSYLNQYDLFFDLTNVDDGYGNNVLSIVLGNLDYEKTEFVHSMKDEFYATTRFVSSLDDDNHSSNIYAEADLIGWANLRRNIVYVNLDHKYNDDLVTETDYEKHIEHHEIEHLAQYRNHFNGTIYDMEAQAIYASIYLSQNLPNQLNKMYKEFYGYDMKDPYKTVYDVFIQELRNRYGFVGDKRGIEEFDEKKVRNLALDLYNEIH